MDVLKVIRMECPHCKQELTVQPYFSNIHIRVEEAFCEFEKEYIAHALATTLCPYCGNKVEQVCETPIYRDDIIGLAVRRVKH